MKRTLEISSRLFGSDMVVPTPNIRSREVVRGCSEREKREIAIWHEMNDRFGMTNPSFDRVNETVFPLLPFKQSNHSSPPFHHDNVNEPATMSDLELDVPQVITSLSSLVESITATATSSALLADATGFLNDTLDTGLDLGGAGLENGAGAGNPVVCS